MVKIVADTTAGLDPGWASQHGVPLVPQVIYFGEESFLEVEEMDTQEFLRRLRTSPLLPRTAAPPPGRFIQAFEELDAGKNTLICLHPSAEVSGTVRSAQTAKEQAFPDADIRIIDTRTIAGQLAVLVMLATDWAEAGVDADTIVARVQGLIPRLRSHFMVDTLEYLQKGGRIGGAAAVVAQLLQVKPILTLRDGTIQALARERTKKRALARLKELVVEEVAGDVSPCIQVMHAEAPEEGEALAAFFRETLGRDDVLLSDLVPAVVTHAGPRTLAVGFFARP